MNDDDVRNLARALEKDPADRTPTALALAEDLRRIRADEPVRARPLGVAARVRRWVQRDPWLAGATASLVVTLAAGLLASLHLYRVAETRLGDVLRLSDGVRVDALVREAAELWPAHPDLRDAMTEWIEQFHPWVAAQVRLRLGDAADEHAVEDVAAEVWLVLLARREDLAPRDGRGDFAVGARADSSFTGKVCVCSGAQVAAGVGAPFLHVLAGPAASSFGYAVAGLGDVDGDGFDDLAVGAPSFTTEDGDVGAVYVHSGASGNVLFSASVGAHGQQFGLSVGAADVDGDGVRDLLVGAPGGPGA